MPTPQKRLEGILPGSLDTARARAMADANVEMIGRVVAGKGPDKVTIDPGCGARVAVNMAAVHVPAFCKSTYRNAYQLTAAAAPPVPGLVPTKSVLGHVAPPNVREFVDGVLESITKKAKKDIYFGAVELNGAGIRFYGDVCLVLKQGHVEADTCVLETNSYDLARPPLTLADEKLDPAKEAALILKLKDMWGLWGSELTQLVAIKVFSANNLPPRRLTTGQISQAVLNDEDYLEVLMKKTFSAADLQAARLSPADAAAETNIGEQLRAGLGPSIAELQWRKHRRAAVRALRGRAVPTAVVTTSGRVRT